MSKIIPIFLLINIGIFKLAQNSPLINSAILMENSRQKRQAPFDELIQSALQLVRPIFGSAKHIAKSVTANQQQESPMLGKKPREQPRLSSARLRELDILGLGHNDEMLMAEGDADLMPPICQGNSRICKFIACTAHNFKNDQNIANLQLATQLLADKKLRRTVGANSGAIGDVCREQGMSPGQCALFARSFQLIDRFMTTIEDQQQQQLEADEEGERGAVLKEEEAQKIGQKMLRHENLGKNSTAQNAGQKPGRVKPKIVTSPSTKTPTTTTAYLSNDRIFEPLDDQESVPRRFPLPSIAHSGNIPSGSRTWSVQKHPPPPPPSHPNLLELAQQDEKHKNRQQQIRRPPQPPNSPPRALDSGNAAGQSGEIRRRLISYSTVPMQMLHTDPNDGAAILISRTNVAKNAQAIPFAQTIPAQKKQQMELGRPKQRFSTSPIAGMTGGQQQIPLEQRPIPQQIPPPPPFPPIISSAMPTMFPPSFYGTTKGVKSTTTSSTIPEAEEFAEEDAAAVKAELEMLNNELNNWMIRFRDAPAADYYDDLANESQKPKNQRQNGNNSNHNQRQNRTKNADENEENEYLDNEGIMGKILPKSVGKVPSNSAMENCLQYLG